MEHIAGHAALMDATYRRQRLIYDATRAYFLFGRDRLISELKPSVRDRVLEVACGTGRNLDRILKAYPDRPVHGLDISREMLKSASVKLGSRAFLAEGDACGFDGRDLFGVPSFDRIVLSYALSMIPDWPQAVRNATRHLAPGGELHIVDFHDFGGFPVWFRRLMSWWLAKFHVAPRRDLAAVCRSIAEENGFGLRQASLYGGYAQAIVIRRG